MKLYVWKMLIKDGIYSSHLKWFYSCIEKCYKNQDDCLGNYKMK